MLKPLFDHATLLPSEATVKRDRNRAYLKKLTAENLLRSHYLEAGLIRMNGKELNIHWGWDSTTSDIRGTVCGHFLSAVAHLVREVKDDELLARANFIVDEIGRCQEANGGRWAFPIPEKYMYWLRDGRHPWAPQYVCHKNMMGLLDMYRFTGNQKALDIALKCADWFYDFTNSISRETMDEMMDLEETGGIMEYWADLYSVTGDPKHLELMRRYERPRLADGLLAGVDMLTNMHANSTIPEIQGYARAYEVTGEKRYRDVVEAYWKQAVTDRGTYATGGQTCGEVWTPMGTFSARLGELNQEHCVVYNMMRLSDYLLRWTGDSKYADYWEKGLYNGIYAQGYWKNNSYQSQVDVVTPNPVTTVAYYLPMNPGAVKRWGSEFDHFWCCHCTLLQANAIHHESIYYQDGSKIYIAQYIPSQLNFCLDGVNGQIRMVQDTVTGGEMMRDARINREVTTRPHYWKFNIQLKVDTAKQFDIMLRLPEWTHGKTMIMVDGEEVAYESKNGFAMINRVWSDALISIVMPKKLECVALPDDPDMVAFVDGPVCLAGLVTEEHMLFGDIENPENSILCADTERAWQSWGNGWKTYHQPFGVRFKPLYDIGYEAYTLYFPVKRQNS